MFPSEGQSEDATSQIYEYPFWFNEAQAKSCAETPKLSDFLDTFATPEEEASYLVPPEFILSRASFRFGELSIFFFFSFLILFTKRPPSSPFPPPFVLVDIVTPSQSHCSCFTKAYGTGHVFGSGSFIQTRAFDAKYDFNDPATLLPLGLRFFTPTEIAKLHGFPIGNHKTLISLIVASDLTDFPPHFPFSYTFKRPRVCLQAALGAQGPFLQFPSVADADPAVQTARKQPELCLRCCVAEWVVFGGDHQDQGAGEAKGPLFCPRGGGCGGR